MPMAFHILIALLIATSAPIAYPAEWKIEPTLRFRVGYNDNLRLNVNNKISTAEATFSPSAVFSISTPTSGASGNLRFDFRRFEDDSDLNDDNVRLNVNTFHNMERSRLGLDLGVIRDTTLDSTLEATGLAFDRINRQRIDVSPSWTYSFSQRTRLNANYSFSDVTYQNPGTSGFIDFTLNSGQASLTHVLNERAIATLTLSGSRSNNDNNTESTNINLQGGGSYQFSETLSASLFIGVRRTNVDFSRNSQIPIKSGNATIGFLVIPRNISSSDWGSTYNASITKTFLRGETSLSATRSISNDIDGQPIETTQLRSTNLYRFNKILSANMNLEFYNSQSNNNVGSSFNRNYYQIEPTFS